MSIHYILHCIWYQHNKFLALDCIESFLFWLKIKSRIEEKSIPMLDPQFFDPNQSIKNPVLDED
jgi:hypothetical protein